MSQKIAVVTGSNDGLGFEIAKEICSAGHKTIICCKIIELADAAARQLKQEGYDALSRQLDTGCTASIKEFRQYI